MIRPDTPVAARSAYKEHLETSLKAVDDYKPENTISQRQWKGIVWPASGEADRCPESGVSHETLIQIGKASVAVPDNFVSTRGSCATTSTEPPLYLACRTYIHGFGAT